MTWWDVALANQVIYKGILKVRGYRMEEFIPTFRHGGEIIRQLISGYSAKRNLGQEFIIIEGSASSNPWVKFGPMPDFVKMFYWKTAMPIHLCVVY